MAEKFTATEKLEAIKREIRLRQYVYPRRIGSGKMTKAKADHEIEIMSAIAADYEEPASKERLL